MRKRSSQGNRPQRTLSAKRRRHLALEALEDRVVLTQLSIGLFDTGVDATGAILSGGAADQHYTLPITQEGTPGMNAVVASPLSSGWAPNGSSSAWIAPSADQGGSSTSPTGTYRYRTTFNVSDPGGGGKLTGNLGGDDNITDVFINGVSTGYSRANAFASFAPISLTGNLVAGVNTLDFVVANTGTGASSTGFHAQDLAINILPGLTIDSSTVQYISGASVVNSGTFGDPDSGDTVTITSNVGTVSQNGTQSGTYSYFEGNVTANHTVTITATDSRGGVKSVSFYVTNQANIPPSLTAGGDAPAVASSGGAAVVVDSNIVVEDPDGPNLTTASVSIGSNFTAAEDRLLFTNQNGITGSYSTSTGILTLSGSATAAQYQAALRSVRYQNINTGTPNQAARTISFSIAPGTFNPTTGHFYEFVPSPGIAWTTARSAALGRNIFGLKGYLATLTSAAENTFAFSKVNSVGWIGASDAAVEGDWRWMDGPEAGLLFYRGLGTSNGAPVGGNYNNWATGEPNDAGNEDYAHYLANGQWNDYANTTTVQGYVVEYGGSAGDPSLILTSAANVNVVSRTATPTVTTPSAATFVNTASATIDGTVASGSLVQVYNDLNGNGVIDTGDSVVASSQLAVGVTAYSVVVPLAQDAPNRFLVSATAAPSGESKVALVPTITQDSTPPSFPEVVSPSAPITVNSDSIAITGYSESGTLVQVYLDLNQDGVPDMLVGSQQLAIGTSDFSIDVPLIQDSVNDFLVVAVDAAGNISVANLVPVVTEDSTAPAVPAVTSPVGPIALNTPAATIAGTAEAGSLVQIYDDANGNGVIDNGEQVVGSVKLAPGETIYGIDVPLALDALNNFLVTSTDAGSNESVPAVVPTITQDSTAPALPTVTDPTSPFTINASVYRIVGTAESGSLVLIFRDDNNNGAIDAGEGLVASQQLAPGQTDYSINVPLLDNMANDFVVTATDAGGNSSGLVDVPTITADSIPPAVPIVISPTNPATLNADNLVVSGTVEAGSLVLVYVDGNNNGVFDEGDLVVGSQQLGFGETDFNITTPLTPDTVNRFLVASLDAGGNVSDSAIVPAITEDSTAPAVPTLLSPTGPITVNTATTTLSGEAEAGSLVQVFDDANGNGILDIGELLVGSQLLVTGETAYSITVPLVPNATNRFLIVSTDAGGNFSTTAVPSITQDSITPAVPTVTSPTSPATLNADNLAVSGTAEAGSLVLVYIDGNDNGVFDDGDLVVGSQQLGAGETDFNITTPLTPDAVNRFLVANVDAGGNVSDSAIVPAITEDSTAPAVPTLLSPSGPVTVNTATTTLSGEVEAGSLVQIFDDANGNGMLDDGEVLVGSQQLATGETTYRITVPLKPNATNRFLIVSTDAGGNFSTTVVPAITQDSVGPAVPTVTSPTGLVAINAATTRVMGTAEAGSLVQVFRDSNNNGAIDAGEVVVGSVQLASGVSTYSVEVPLTPNQPNNFVVAATDAGGNRSVAVDVPTITSDSIAPTAPTVTAPAGLVSVSKPSVPITGKAEANSLIRVYRDVNNNGRIDSEDTVVGFQMLANGATSYSINVPLTANAANNFLVTATDSVGNRSAAVDVPTVTQDSRPPAVPTFTGPFGPIAVKDTTRTFNGTAEPGSLVRVYRDSNGDGVIGEGDEVVGSFQLAPGQTDYSITVPLAKDSANQFLISSTDPAGNLSTLIVVPTITQDSLTPTVPVSTDPAGPSTVTSNSITLDGNAEPGSLVAVFADTNGNGIIDDGDALVGGIQLDPGQTAYSITVPLQPNAANQFLISARDDAGNLSTPVVSPTFNQVSTPPSMPTSNGQTVSTTVNGNATTLTGTADAGSLIAVFLDTNGNGVIDAEDGLVAGIQLAGGQTDYSVDVPLVGGQLLVTAVDANQNFSPALVVPTQPAPRIDNVQRFGFHLHPTYLVLSFAGPMDAVRAQDPANYRLVDARGRAMRISGIQYDAAANSVTLAPTSRLSVFRKYFLTVNGAGPNGLASASGTMLDGLGTGQSGSDFTIQIDRSLLAGQSPLHPTAASRLAVPVTVTPQQAAFDSILASGVRVRKAR